jgi:hypothetical protein
MAVRQVSDKREAGSGSPARRCFIAARPQANIEPIRGLLSERGIDATASYERPWLGARPLDTVMALIEDADLVVAILDEPTASANILFELGYAFARDKKIMVIQPRSLKWVPSDLAATLYVQADLVETEALAYNLDALLAAPAPVRKPYIPDAPETHPIGDRANALLRRLERAVSENDAIELERVTIDAIRESGVRIIQSVGERGVLTAGPDLGVWSDDLESSVGNPLLIELKLRIPTRSALRSVRERVREYARLRNREWALILYGEGPPHWDAEVESEAPILILGARQFVERLRTEGFAAVVGSLRDRAIRAG